MSVVRVPPKQYTGKAREKMEFTPTVFLHLHQQLGQRDHPPMGHLLLVPSFKSGAAVWLCLVSAVRSFLSLVVLHKPLGLLPLCQQMDTYPMVAVRLPHDATCMCAFCHLTQTGGVGPAMDECPNVC